MTKVSEAVSMKGTCSQMKKKDNFPLCKFSCNINFVKKALKKTKLLANSRSGKHVIFFSVSFYLMPFLYGFKTKNKVLMFTKW